MQKEKKINIKKLIPLFVIAVLIIGIIVFGITISRSDKIYPNIYVGDISLGNKTQVEAMQLLMDKGWTEKTKEDLKVKTYCNTYVVINPVQAGVMIDSNNAVSGAVRYGKTGNIIQNLVSYIKCIGKKVDLNEIYTAINTNYINEKIALLQTSLNENLKEDAFKIDKATSELVIYKGYGTGITLNTDGLYDKIIDGLKNGESEISCLTAEGQEKEPNLERLYELASADPQDAYFATDGSKVVVEQEPGYTFDIEIARELLKKASIGDEVRIPLNVTEASLTKEQLESQMYIHLIGAMTTKYNNSNDNRSSNVRLATSLVNETVIFPGEEFSFNDIVGKRTEEAGFLPAPAYAGYDDMKDEIGGGVCQVSSGIYASALFAFLDITSHTCHVYPPNYIQLGTDATVSIPEDGRKIDLKFKNNKSFPIKIVGYCDETTDPNSGKPLKKCTIEIWGTLEDGDYMPVEFDNAWGDVYDYDRKIDPVYPDRAGYRLQFTHDETEFEDDNGKGIRTLTYRRVYDADGNVVEKKILNKEYDFGYGMDTYYFKE